MSSAPSSGCEDTNGKDPRNDILKFYVLSILGVFSLADDPIDRLAVHPSYGLSNFTNTKGRVSSVHVTALPDYVLP